MDFLFDFEFILFFQGAIRSIAIGVHFVAGRGTFGAGLKSFLCPNHVVKKRTEKTLFSALRTISLLLPGGGYSANRVEPLGDAVGVNEVELERAPRVRGKALLLGVLGLKHLVAQFWIGLIVNLAGW